MTKKIIPKKIRCTKCGYSEDYDSILELNNILCPNCGYENSMMAITQVKKTITQTETENKKLYTYKYLASNKPGEWHTLTDTQYGEIDALTEPQAYHMVKKKYSSVLMLGNGRK